MGYLDEILGQTEKVLLITRRHWLSIAGLVIGSAVIMAMIVAAAFVLNAALPQANGLPLLLLLLLIFPLGRLVIHYLAWWNEQYILTNRRIIQIDGIFNKQTIDSSLEKVNDVVMTQSAMGRLLGYGDLEIMTASDIGVNKLERIANPILFKTTMLNAKEGLVDLDNFQGRVRMTDLQPAHRDTIPELIDELASLRDRGLITDAEFQTKKAELMARL